MSGSNNINTNVHTLTQIFQTTTTTNTFLTTEVYDLIGIPVVAPVPEPSTMLLTAAGLAGLGLLRRNRLRRRASPLDSTSANC